MVAWGFRRAPASTSAQLRRRPRPVPLIVALLMAKLVLLRLLVFDAPGPGMLLVDLAAVVVLVGVVALLAPGPATSPALWALNAAVSVFLVTSVIYAGYYQTLPTFTSLDEADQAADIRSSVPGLLRWEMCLFFVDLVAAPVVGARMHGHRWLPPRTRHGRPRLVRLGAMVAAGALVVGFVIDSGTDVRNEHYRAEHFGIFGYEADALVRAARKEPTLDLATAYERVTELKESRLGPPVRPEDARGFGSARGKNLVVVQLESMQTFVIGLEVGGQEVTPNLNALVGESYYFPRHFQQVGKGNTVDAEFVSNTSIYPVGDVAMSTAYGDRDLPSLPKLLRKRQYISETFNVNWAKFWDHDDLFRSLGFDRWHEKDEYPGEKFNYWGVSDEEFYLRSVSRLLELDATGRPFYTQLVTASGHGPFDVPADEVRLDLPDDLQGTEVGAYLQAQNYADYALGRFIDALKRLGLWDKSLFVAYGDHAGLNTDDTVEGVRSLGVSYDFLRRFNTPLVVHVPGQKGSREETLAGTVDIVPTVANLLGISLARERFVHFGVDLLNTEPHVVGERYHAPTGTFVNEDVIFVPGRGFPDGSARRLSDGGKASLEGLRDDYDYVVELMDTSDAYVRSLPRR